MAFVAMISGSPLPSSRTWRLASWAGQWLGAQGFEVQPLEVREIPADDLLFARVEAPAVRNALAVVERARGMVIVTPVYKAAYSGLLKAFIDLLPQFGLTGKVVLPLAVGGTLAHVLAIDYAMRPMLSSLGALHITEGLFLLDKQLERTDDGRVAMAEETELRLRSVLQGFADSLRRHTTA
jgi:FMN reductase